MSTFSRTTSSDVAFSVGTPVGFNQHGSVLRIGSDVYTITSSSLGLTSADVGGGTKELLSEILIEDVLCVKSERSFLLSSDILFEAFIAGETPGENLDDPPDGITIDMVFRRKQTDSLIFDQILEVSGGRVLDVSCNPPRYVANEHFDDWVMLGEWSELGEWYGFT